MKNLPLSTQEVKAQFRAEGVTVKEWAEREGFAPGLVYQLIAGRISGTRGKSHEIAVRLRLKSAVDDPVLSSTAGVGGKQMP